MSVDTQPAVVDIVKAKTKLGERAAQMLSNARSVRIAKDEDYEFAAAAVQTIKRAQQDVSELLDPVCKAAHEAHRVAVAQRNEITKPLEEAESLIKAEMLRWSREQQRIERERIALEQERQRLLAIEAAKKEAELRGANEQEVKAVEREAEMAPPPPVAVRTVARAKGATISEHYTAEIESLDKFLQSQIELKGFGLLAHPNVVAALNQLLAAQARTAKTTMSISGVRVWDVGKVGVRT